jgi:hypothetical protein
VNRADLTKQVLLYDQLAAAAKAKAAVARQLLDEQAKAELETQGMAPTWRLQDIGTITLPISQQTVYVADSAALVKWAAGISSSAVVEETTVRMNPEWHRGLEQNLIVIGDAVVWKPTGEVVPGYAVRQGGLPMALSIRPSADAKALAREYAEGLLANFEASLTGEQAEA